MEKKSETEIKKITHSELFVYKTEGKMRKKVHYMQNPFSRKKIFHINSIYIFFQDPDLPFTKPTLVKKLFTKTPPNYNVKLRRHILIIFMKKFRNVNKQLTNNSLNNKDLCLPFRRHKPKVIIGKKEAQEM